MTGHALDILLAYAAGAMTVCVIMMILLNRRTRRGSRRPDSEGGSE